jgi:hypothetical protein
MDISWIFHGAYPYDIGIKTIGFQYAYPQDSGETSMFEKGQTLWIRTRLGRRK